MVDLLPVMCCYWFVVCFVVDWFVPICWWWFATFGYVLFVCCWCVVANLLWLMCYCRVVVLDSTLACYCSPVVVVICVAVYSFVAVGLLMFWSVLLFLC